MKSVQMRSMPLFARLLPMQSPLGHALWYAEECVSVEGLIAVASREAAAELPLG